MCKRQKIWDNIWSIKNRGNRIKENGQRVKDKKAENGLHIKRLAKAELETRAREL